MDAAQMLAVTGPALGTIALVVALLYLRAMPGAPLGLGWWSAAFFLVAARPFVPALAPVAGAPLAAILLEGLEGAAALLLAAGGILFLGGRLRVRLVWFGIAAVFGWAAFATHVLIDPGFLPLPIHLLSAFLLGRTGLALLGWRSGGVKDLGRAIAGTALIGWAVANAQAVFQAGQGGAGWALLLAQGFGAAAAVGLLVAAQRRLQWRAERAERIAREGEERLRVIIESSPAPSVISRTGDGRVLFANHRAAAALGVAPRRARRLTVRQFLADPNEYHRLIAALRDSGEVEDLEVRLARPGGGMAWVLVSARLMRFEGEDALFIAFNDITERKAAADRLHELATRDALTGLYNRRFFFLRGEEEFGRSRRYGSHLAVVMLDVDHFKAINDTHGHAVGDQALRAIAKTCQELMRESDVIGRYGGEEFAVLLPETDLAEAEKAAQRLRSAVESLRLATGDAVIRPTISLGVAAIATDVADLDALLSRADGALYEAKRTGRNRAVTAGLPTPWPIRLVEPA